MLVEASAPTKAARAIGAGPKPFAVQSINQEWDIERDDERSADGGTARDSDQLWVGEWIAKQCLQSRTTTAERGADQAGDRHSRQA